MGMCAIRGPRALDDEDASEEVEFSSPRSCTTVSTSYSAFGSATSQDLDDIAEAVSHLYEDGAIWQRAIPRGQRCKPLSFAGAILYDENGHLLTLPYRKTRRWTSISALSAISSTRKKPFGAKINAPLQITVSHP